MWCSLDLSCYTVIPPMNLRVRGVSENTVDLEWEGSMILTDFFITCAPTTPGGVQLEIRVPGNVTNTTIKGLEPGLEYNINVYAVFDNIISAPMNTIVSTCECTSLPRALLFKSASDHIFFKRLSEHLTQMSDSTVSLYCRCTITQMRHWVDKVA